MLVIVAGQKFAHREHLAPHPQRRQYLEHIVVFNGRLKPFPGIERGCISPFSVQGVERADRTCGTSGAGRRRLEKLF